MIESPETEDARFTAEIQAAADVPAMHSVCRRLVLHLGFEYFIYAVRLPLSLTQPYHFCLSGYPPAWRERYETMGYVQIDPIIAHAFSSALPIFWDEVARDGDCVARLFREAAEFGLCDGVSAPISTRRGDFAVLSIAGAQEIPLEPSFRSGLRTRVHWFSSVLHESICRIVLNAEGWPILADALSQREKDCLKWVADGKTSPEIARCLGISTRTVLFHIENAGSKLGVSGRHNIVSRAIALGEIDMMKEVLYGGAAAGAPSAPDTETED